MCCSKLRPCGTFAKDSRRLRRMEVEELKAPGVPGGAGKMRSNSNRFLKADLVGGAVPGQFQTTTFLEALS